MDVIKAHGTGNDFVVVPDRDGVTEVDEQLVRRLCDRRTGVGADGLIRLAPPSNGGAVFMDYRNADGSVVEMCGNGIRVVTMLVHDLGWVALADGDTLDVETRAGLRQVVATVEADVVTMVSVDMGPDNPDPAASDFTESLSAATVDLDVPGHGTVTASITSMGNPHAVLVVDDVDAAPVRTLGPALEQDRRWRNGVNVGFLEPTSRSTARLRVWERGVGETMACGSGACAALATGHRLGLFDDEVTLDVPGGRLVVTRDRNGHLHLRGPAAVVARVTLDERWLAAR